MEARARGPAHSRQPNVVHLRLTLAQIEAHPETWEQGEFRCETGLCVAGWGAQLAGGRWLFKDPTSFHAYMLVAGDGDDPEDCEVLYGQRVISAHYRAMRLFGLTSSQAHVLFEADNTLADVRRIIGELCAGAGS